MKKGRYKKIKNRLVAFVTAGAATVGLLLGSTFDSPAQLLEDRELPPAPAAIVQLVEPEEDGADDVDDAQLPGEEKRRSLRARLRQAFLGLPFPLRLSMGVPLWLLGWLLINALSALWTGVISPVGSAALGAAATSSVLGAAALGAVKAAFPELSVRSILDRHTLLRLLLGSLLYSLLSMALDIFLPDDFWLCNLTKGAALLAALLWAALPILLREKKRRAALSAAEEEEIKLKEAELCKSLN